MVRTVNQAGGAAAPRVAVKGTDMRTTTLRGLAAGAGAAAVLVAGAAAAAAMPGKPTAAYWEGYYAQQGYSDVSCYVSVMPGDRDTTNIRFTESDWGPKLAEGDDWFAVVLKVANDYDPQAWQGYEATYSFGGTIPGNSPGNVTHAILCSTEAGATPTPPEPTQTEPAVTEEPSGPPVETDGPSSPGG